MIISTKHKFIYLGINKTGTTSIENALWQYRNRYHQKYLHIKHNIINKGKPDFKHNPAMNIRTLVGNKIWHQYFSFTFVRNPWARVLSEYTRHIYDGNMPLKEGFTEWVQAGGNWLAKENTMKQFVADSNGEIIIDYIGKLENIDDDLKKICNEIGIESIALQKFNKSKQKYDYRDIYINETREIVTEWVAEDAEQFGYEFDFGPCK